MSERTVRVLETPESVAEAAAELFVQCAKEAIRERGRFLFALAGGSTPEMAYSRLAEKSGVPWDGVFAFVGDERMVPADDPRSNFGMARRALLDRVPIPAANVFPVPTDAPSAEEAARLYESTLSAVFVIPAGDAPPRFDLIFLGLGDDGHTASLFPGKPALNEGTKWVTASEPGVLPPAVDRVTLTFPVPNAARTVVFLVAGEKKAAVLRDVLDGNDFPATRVRPVAGTVVWLVDREAAGKLDRVSR